MTDINTSQPNMSRFNTALVHLPSSASTVICDDKTVKKKTTTLSPQDVLVCQCVCVCADFNSLSQGTLIHPAGSSQRVIMRYTSHLN
jgi:hypothetical protein